MSEAPPPVDQIEFWNGLVGQKWADNQERLDRAFGPVTARLLDHAAVRPGERVLDVGCGAGVLSLEVARRAGPGGRVLAVDVSRPMLARARARAAEDGADRAPIEWQEGDAARFAFAPGAFDLVISRFGVMFFADPVEAFRNLRRALRSGGRLVMLCWRTLGENDWVTVPRAALLKVLPPPPPLPPDAPGPFAFSDAARVGAILARAGFDEVRSAPIDDQFGIGSAPLEQIRFVTELGPASALLRDVPDDVRERALLSVRAAFEQRSAAGGAALTAACWLFTAQNRP